MERWLAAHLPCVQSAKPVPGQAEGAEYGLPPSQIRGKWLAPRAVRGRLLIDSNPIPVPHAARGGQVTVKVPAEIADRFNRAVVSGKGVVMVESWRRGRVMLARPAACALAEMGSRCSSLAGCTEQACRERGGRGHQH